MIKKLVKILLSLTQGKSDKEKQEIVRVFLKLLAEKNQLHLLPAILKELKREEKKQKIELILARNFEQEFLQKIERGVKKTLGEKEIKLRIEPEIIGGFLAKDENYLIDGSIKGILNNFKERLWTHLKF
ncbi:MAG TPA: F0F1 ATP synthase subunit delta [Candidatus Paceibacterota bacterium]|mgnify:CR=1 FL=1|jgi:F0F1-type ATP synthase delta subunit|nr:F0F1 ATP synthase subunit delta [Candidatus Pacearchaeota archaeon]HPZ74578.1 F0F1 ATP synthase subunit delta [Candidatus Pacearchaeota archaeon]HQD89162.1 F0F1 ATP synthase subunit delta [Candidatus Pacearchaeota archaeon]HRR39341.1 F0F1 ATP synthase subunit delta [Candidatus Paceibacterota bacterium]